MIKLSKADIFRTTYTSFGLPEPDPTMIKWHQLSKYCADNNKDFYIELYSRFFKVPYDKVTPEQRAEAKHYFIGIIYSRGGMIDPPEGVD